MGIAGGISLLGPANRTGEALFEKTGSVRIVNPSLLIKAWYEYVTIPYSNEINGGNFAFFLE